MSDDTQPIQVQISASSVHKAVRNILKNECKVDAEEIRKQAREGAELIIRTEVFAYLSENGYGTADLKNRIQSTLEARLRQQESDVRAIVKEIVKGLVLDHIREQTLEVVAAVIKDGLTVKIGWNKEIKIKVEGATEGKADGSGSR
jgi:hypothetical protein